MSILTVSREYGSGGREIGQGVAEKLNYEYIDKEQILREMCVHGKQWEQWAQGLDEHAPSVWERFDWSFRGFGALLRSIILEHALKDNVVIMGRGGNIILAGVPYAYKIRVVAPINARIERIMLRESVDYDTARWLAEKTDKDRRQFFKAMFGTNWNSPKAYDKIYDTENKPVEKVIEATCKILTQLNEKKNSEAEDSLRTRATAARIEAGLLTYPLLFVNTIEVVIEGKDLVLKGVVRDPKHRKKVQEIASKLAGAIPLIDRLHYRGV
jgi:cytidylate kinase